MSFVERKPVLILCHGDRPCAGYMTTALEKVGLTHVFCHTSKGQKLPQSYDDFSGVIVMGGPMAIYHQDKIQWLAQEVAWVEGAVDAGLPVFGVCLGCQMLAHIFDGEVFAGEKGLNVGYRTLHLLEKDETFGDELSEVKGFSWQEDTYKIGSGQRLMSGNYYYEQAVKFSDKVYGVQFHPEMTEETVKRWYSREELMEDLIRKDGVMSEEKSLEIAKIFMPVMHGWLDVFVRRLFL